MKFKKYDIVASHEGMAIGIYNYKGIETDYYRCDCCGDYVETYELTI